MANEVQKQRSVIKMAESYSIGSTLIIGKPQTGRTTLAIKMLEGKKVLWLSCNNLGVVGNTDKLGEGSMLYVISKWQQLLDLVGEIKKGQFEAVVIDGLNNAKDFWFAHTFPLPDAFIKQSDWQNMSKDLARMVVDFRDRAMVFAIVDIEKTADETKVVNDKPVKVEGRNDMALNLDAQRRIIGLFDNKIQTVIKQVLTPNPAKGTLDASMEYQTLSGASALNFN